MVQVYGINTGGNFDACVLRFNNDTGSNYALRKSNDGGSDSTNVSENGLNYMSTGTTQNHFVVFNIINESSKEKLVNCEMIRDGGSGAGSAPSRKEMTGKWANTSNQITRVDVVNRDGSGNYAIDSEVTVYGTD